MNLKMSPISWRLIWGINGTCVSISTAFSFWCAWRCTNNCWCHYREGRGILSS